MSHLIQLSGASFGYEKGPVVADVDLAVDAGDLVGIIGPNGAGKTTLFRGILGLIAPLGGTVDRSRARVGYVPQRETLDPLFPLSAEEVVAMGAYGRLRGVRRLSREDRDAATSAIERLGLAAKRRAPFASLSGGQRQRILIARALLVRPNVLLLDEPTSGVDRGAQAQILQILRDLNREGLAILIVSHQLAMVRDAVQRVLWVGDGKVTQGSPDDVLHPESVDRLFSAGSRGGSLED